jgi:hypothetical protein
MDLREQLTNMLTLLFTEHSFEDIIILPYVLVTSYYDNEMGNCCPRKSDEVQALNGGGSRTAQTQTKAFQGEVPVQA